MMVFPEEQELLTTLLVEWYEEMAEFTRQADAIFGERGRHLDRHSPPWMRHDFPEGYAHEIGKKNGRIQQFLSCDPVPWDKILDELKDITNYSRMMAAVIRMLQRRPREVKVVDHHCGPNCDCGGKGESLQSRSDEKSSEGKTDGTDLPRPTYSRWPG